ncbi:MAG: hypothetical protein QOG26_167 [Solirubrobacterales bacterium]|jgi:hypothetical protein|nr:hypothetical protein [Solirubrobacterales bacterium]
MRARVSNFIRGGRVAAFAGALALAAIASPASAGAVTLTRVTGHDFNSPVYVTQPPNGGPLLVVEQPGVIRAIKGNSVRSTPFLDIRGRVTGGGEQGLLSVAFPPNYARTHLFYVYYTNRGCSAAGDCDIEIDEFHRSRSNSSRADASSRRRVLTIPHRQAGNHNGGQLQFDRHGRLYAGTGDGGGGGDQFGNALNRNRLLGKLLRIYPRAHRGHPYTVPSGNPYVGRKGRDEIYSRGLRNPWRFSIDQVGSSEFLAIGDVGQGNQEEVDYETLGGALGANFGWNQFEGFLTYPGGALAGSQPNPPIFAYSHGGAICPSGGCAIAGGYVVHDPALPSLSGRYVYADTYQGDLRSFVPALGGSSGDQAVTDGAIPLHVDFVSSFGRDMEGQIYVASLNGPVFRLTP